MLVVFARMSSTVSAANMMAIIRENAVCCTDWLISICHMKMNCRRSPLTSWKCRSDISVCGAWLGEMSHGLSSKSVVCEMKPVEELSVSKRNNVAHLAPRNSHLFFIPTSCIIKWVSAADGLLCLVRTTTRYNTICTSFSCRPPLKCSMAAVGSFFICWRSFASVRVTL